MLRCLWHEYRCMIMYQYWLDTVDVPTWLIEAPFSLNARDSLASQLTGCRAFFLLQLHITRFSNQRKFFACIIVHYSFVRLYHSPSWVSLGFRPYNFLGLVTTLLRGAYLD